MHPDVSVALEVPGPVVARDVHERAGPAAGRKLDNSITNSLVVERRALERAVLDDLIQVEDAHARPLAPVVLRRHYRKLRAVAAEEHMTHRFGPDARDHASAAGSLAVVAAGEPK